MPRVLTPISESRSIPGCRAFLRPDGSLARAMQDENLNERIQQIEDLVRQAEALSDPKAHALAVELLQAVLKFHAAGLERLIEIIGGRGEPGRAILDALAAD